MFIATMSSLHFWISNIYTYIYIRARARAHGVIAFSKFVYMDAAIGHNAESGSWMMIHFLGSGRTEDFAWNGWFVENKIIVAKMALPF